jgi:glycosyltransferase involved in cell wall biosynthesis
MVASGVCGNPEVVEHGVNGLLVDPYDSASVAAGLSRLLKDPEEGRRFAAAGLERSVEFLRETTFAEVEAVLGAAAGRGSQP